MKISSVINTGDSTETLPVVSIKIHRIATSEGTRVRVPVRIPRGIPVGTSKGPN